MATRSVFALRDRILSDAHALLASFTPDPDAYSVNDDPAGVAADLLGLNNSDLSLGDPLTFALAVDFALILGYALGANDPALARKVASVEIDLGRKSLASFRDTILGDIEILARTDPRSIPCTPAALLEAVGTAEDRDDDEDEDDDG